jgi:DNA-binding NarL/FixJ family response regulator
VSIRVLLADDHPMMRAGIRAVLDEAPDIEVVGEAENGLQAQELIQKFHPDILLLDVVMPGPRPAELEAWVRTHSPDTTTLVLTAHDRDAYLVEMMAAGVKGFVTKEEASAKLVDAIRHVYKGESTFSGEQFVRARRWREEVGDRWNRLTERERELLRLLGSGLDNAAIADKLEVTTKTVEYHITNILSKLNVASRLEAVVWVRDHLPEEFWGEHSED